MTHLDSPCKTPAGASLRSGKCPPIPGKFPVVIAPLSNIFGCGGQNHRDAQSPLSAACRKMISMRDEPDSRGDAHGRSPQDQRPANSVLLEVASLAHSAVRKIKNEDLLGGIALFAIGAVLSAIFFLTRGALSTANCAVGVAFLVAPFGFYILMNWKRRRNKPSPGSPDGIPHTVGLLRDQLLRLSEPELLAFQKRSQLPPFPCCSQLSCRALASRRTLSLGCKATSTRRNPASLKPIMTA